MLLLEHAKVAEIFHNPLMKQKNFVFICISSGHVYMTDSSFACFSEVRGKW